MQIDLLAHIYTVFFHNYHHIFLLNLVLLLSYLYSSACFDHLSMFLAHSYSFFFVHQKNNTNQEMAFLIDHALVNLSLIIFILFFLIKIN